MLLGEVDATIRRFDGGSWATGDYVRGAPVADFAVVGSFQPDRDTEAEALDDSGRKAGSFVFIVELEGQPEVKILSLQAVTEGDRVIVAGVTYIVLKTQDWTSHASGLPHRRFVLERKGGDE